LVFWKEGEQPTKEIELEKGLLDERPASVGDENDEDFPIEDSLNHREPTRVAVGDNSADKKEEENGWDGDPERHFDALFELIPGFRWRE